MTATDSPHANRYTARSGAIATVLVALAASLLLLVAWQLRDAWPPGLRFVWISLAAVPPMLLALLLRHAADLRAWAATAAMTLLLGLLAAWTAATRLDPGDGLSSVLGQHLGIVASASFVLAPFLQQWRDGGPARYARLFQYAWDNALVLLVTLAFVLAGWLILHLWAALFALIGLDALRDLIARPAFGYPISGLLTGVGLALARNQLELLHGLRRVVLRVGELLLVLLALVAIMFVLALPFTGLDALWETRRAASLLLTLVFGLVALQSSVYQDGLQPAPYGRALQGISRLALLTLPIYGLIAAYAVALRVGQYGWTIDRLWAALLVGFALLWGIGHAWAALRRDGPWLRPLAVSNPLVALVIAASLLLTQSPLFDMSRISVASQLARAEAGGDAGYAALDLNYLRWRSGRPGREALQGLRDQGLVDVSEADRLLAQTRPWSAPEETGTAVPYHQVPVIPPGTPVPEALLAALGSPRAEGASTTACREHSCRLLAIDLDGDGVDEWLLLHRNPAGWTSTQLYMQRGTQWESAGYLHGEGNRRSDTLTALDAGDYATRVPRWHALRIGDEWLWLRAFPDG